MVGFIRRGWEGVLMTVDYAMGSLHIPDPESCSHDAWDLYMSRVDVMAMSGDQYRAHVEAFEAYGRRLQREQREVAGRVVSALDARDKANTTADEANDRAQRLQRAALDQGDVVLRLQADLEPDDARLVEARRLLVELQDQASEAMRVSIEASGGAVEAYRNTR
jgi:hypothetical protein